jgi:hypothetical protein
VAWVVVPCALGCGVVEYASRSRVNNTLAVFWKAYVRCEALGGYRSLGWYVAVHASVEKPFASWFCSRCVVGGWAVLVEPRNLSLVALLVCLWFCHVHTCLVRVFACMCVWYILGEMCMLYAADVGRNRARKADIAWHDCQRYLDGVEANCARTAS